MSKSITSAKKSRGRPPVDTEAVNVRLPRELLTYIEAEASERDMTRPEAIRFIVNDWLETTGKKPVEVGEDE